jgi:hypothetical protein
MWPIRAGLGLPDCLGFDAWVVACKKFFFCLCCLISRRDPPGEKLAIMGLKTMAFAIIGLQTWTLLRRHFKHCAFAIIGFLFLLITFVN